MLYPNFWADEEVVEANKGPARGKGARTRLAGFGQGVAQRLSDNLMNDGRRSRIKVTADDERRTGQRRRDPVTDERSRLESAFTMTEPEVSIDDLPRTAFDFRLDPDGTSRFAGKRTRDLRKVIGTDDGEWRFAQNGISVTSANFLNGRVKVKLHGENPRDLSSLIYGARARALDVQFLEANHVRNHLSNHLRNTLRRTAPIHANATVKVIGSDAHIPHSVKDQPLGVCRAARKFAPIYVRLQLR